MWEERAEAYTITVEDSTLLDKAMKLAEKHGDKRRFDQDYLNRKLCKNDTCVEISYKLYEKGDSERIDKTGWEKGVGEVFVNKDKPAFVYILGTQKPSPKDLEYARGMVTADYQEYLEEQWVDDLRDKYEFTVNPDVLSKIKEK